MSQRHRSRIAIILGTIAAVFWAATVSAPHLLGRQSPTDALEASLLDFRFRFHGPGPTPGDIVVVAIDDATLAEAGSDGGGSLRGLLADLVMKSRDSGAAGLVIDVLLAGPGDAQEDRALAAALGPIPSVIAAAGTFPSHTSAGLVPQLSSALLPQALFREVSEIGFVNLAVDQAGTPRHAPMIFESEGEVLPSLILVAAAQYQRQVPQVGEGLLQLGAVDVPLDVGLHLPIRYLGPTGTVQGLSARDLLAGPMPEALSGKLVVLGVTASAMGDRFATPFDAAMPGVEVLATAIAQLLGGPGLVRDDSVRLWDAGLSVGLAALCTALVLAFPLAIGAPAALVLLAFGLAAVVGVFAMGIWMSAALPLASALPPSVAAGVWRYSRERRAALSTENAVAALSKFHSPALARRLAQDPTYLSTPMSHDVVILFVDLTGFTRASQILGPEDTQRFLKDFHGRVAEAVEANGGSVMNFMGDGAFAVFGIEPGEASDPADAALKTAFRLVEKLSSSDSDSHAGIEPGCRIGLHAGPVIFSRLGADSHQQLTVSGDSVNLASRLMEVAKAEHAVIAASDTFMAELKTDEVIPDPTRKTVPIRGREGDVDVCLWAGH